MSDSHENSNAVPCQVPHVPQWECPCRECWVLESELNVSLGIGLETYTEWKNDRTTETREAMGSGKRELAQRSLALSRHCAAYNQTEGDGEAVQTAQSAMIATIAALALDLRCLALVLGAELKGATDDNAG